MKPLKPFFFQSRVFSIANKLRYGLVFIVVSSVAIAGGSLTYLSFQTQQEEIKLLQQQRSRVAASEISAYLDGMQRQLNYLSELRGLTEFPVVTQQRVLEGLVNSNNAYEFVAIIGDRGQMLQAVSPYKNFSSSELNFNQNIVKSPLFIQTFKNGNNYVSPVEIDPKLKLPIATLAVPIRNEKNQINGVLFAKINLNFLSLIISETEVGKTGYAYVFDDRFILIAQKDINPKNFQLQNLEDRPFIKILSKLSPSSNTQPLIAYKGLKEKEVLGAATLVRRVQWTLVVEIPTAEVYAPIRRMIMIMGAAILLCIIGGIICGFTFSRSIILPLKQLNIAAAKISEGLLTSQVEITDRHELGELAQSFNRMAKQLQQSFATLESQNNELQKLDQLKDEFLANTSHELRTPINGIIGIAESLIDGATGELPQTTQANLNLIVYSGRRLSNLVNDILDFSKLRHKNLELKLRPVDLRTVTNLVLTLSQPLITNKDLELLNAIPADIIPAEADEDRLQQILHNLIGNAIKFTPNGSITISAEVLDIDNQIAITISDTGIGIPADKLDSIFESFEQGEGSTARVYGGTGLGLAVTKQLVELHGGKISVKSQIRVGSQFTFTLPISKNKVETPAQVNAIKHRSNPLLLELSLINNNQETINTESGSKVLIVDDEPVNLQVLVNILSLHNYAIYQARNGEEALSLIEKGLKPDIILLDVMMPKMNGYEVTKKLRERFASNELPILLLTAKNQVQDIVTGLNFGANDYLSKPFAKDELLARIRTQVNISRLISENLRMSTELNVTRKLHQMILPKQQELEAIEGLEVIGFMEAANEVGGDYYDVLQHNGSVKIGIGDVTGHGLESGMLMLMVQTAIRTLLESNQTDPVKFLDVVNRTLYGNIQRIHSQKNMTLALLDYADGMLNLSGQHEEIIIVRSDGKVETIDTTNLGFPIGLEKDIADLIASKQVQLCRGDVVLLYTDGITEAESINKELYGLERLREVAINNHQHSAEEIKQAVIEDVRQHIGLQKVFDDITLVVLKQK